MRFIFVYPLRSISMVLLFAITLLTETVFAQENEYKDPERCLERRGLEYGGVAGFYIAGRASAEFYSGKPGNENNVEYVFKNQYWNDEIYQLLNAYDTVIIREYPEKMKYDPAFSFGLFVKYDMNCHNAIYLQFSYAKLTARDVVSLEVDPPIDYLAEPDIRLCPIYGVEERNLVDLGFTHSVGNNSVARFIFGGGINMNNSLVKEHILKVESAIPNTIRDREFNLVNIYGSGSYIPGTGNTGFETRQGGIGFGIFGTIGGRFEFSPVIAIEPGFTVYYKKITVDPSVGFVPQFNFFVRICFRDLVTFAE